MPPSRNWIAGNILGIASDVLGDCYVRASCSDATPPMAVRRHLDVVLEQTRPAVLAIKKVQYYESGCSVRANLL